MLPSRKRRVEELRQWLRLRLVPSKNSRSLYGLKHAAECDYGPSHYYTNELHEALLAEGFEVVATRNGGRVYACERDDER